VDAEQKRLLAIFDRVRTRRPDEVDGAVAELRAYVAGAPRARSSIRARYMLASALVVRADLVGGSTGLQDLAEACGLLEDLWARRLITPPDRLVFGAALAEARAKELTAWFDQVLPDLFAPMAATWEDSSPDIAIPDAGIDAGGLIAALGDPDGTRAEYIRRSDRAEAAYTVAIRLARQVGSLARPQLAALLTSLGGLARNRAQFIGESSGYDRAVETLREAIMLGDGRPTADLVYTQSELVGSPGFRSS